jgi:integrase
MASLYRDEQTRYFHILFRFAGKQYHKSLKTKNEKKANGMRANIEEMLHDLDRGRATLAPDADLWQFLLSNGTRDGKPVLKEKLTVGRLVDAYLAGVPEGAKEKNSLNTERSHLNHVKRVLGQNRSVLGVDMQEEYVNKRARENYRGEPIRSATIKKEISSFRTAWNWSVQRGKVTGPAPVKGLKYAKGKEKLPFMTWGEIEQRIAQSGELSARELWELWDCLFLDLKQVDGLLKQAKSSARFPFIYPMILFVAHTGARRSELCRAQVDDFDLNRQEPIVRIREKKHDQSVEMTFRYVPMSSMLAATMKEWRSDGHLGGPYAFRQALSVHMATKHWKETFAGSKWAKVHGYHVLRHSFASNLAREGIDQRTIDDLMGHETEAMRKRYRHLFPEQRRSAITALFG